MSLSHLWQKIILGRENEGFIDRPPTVFIDQTFHQYKNILPQKENLVIETLRLVVTDTGGLETLYCVESYTLKGEEMWGWSFHLYLCGKRTYLV